eukprot:2290240-Karenia_brevis.AAC.1
MQLVLPFLRVGLDADLALRIPTLLAEDSLSCWLHHGTCRAQVNLSSAPRLLAAEYDVGGCLVGFTMITTSCSIVA